ncbi:AAEL004856-PA [Aedes aegypti]|uniref:AAEL004856-PA n=2 Tax=Aedes aegypti TaxID=7159 RepID=A0A1S4F8U2_AEDAE|nr:general odorant-binding protein 45-like [Aedes aegypti]EAT43756.1 AAEL004856-PA [Aedes aegypti]
MTIFNALLAILACFSLPTDALQHNAVYKSINSAGPECRTILTRQSPLDCRLRCLSINTGDWDDCSGVPRTYDRFYVQDPTDVGYQQRTQQCIANVSVSILRGDICAFSARSTECYDANYYDIVLDQLVFVPSKSLQYQQTIRDCAGMLGFTEHVISDVLRDDCFALQETRCLLRCLLVREGLYGDQCGAQIDRLYVVTGGFDQLFRRDVKKCTGRLRAMGLDKCTEAYRVASECFPEDKAILPIFLKNKAILQEI